MTGKSNSGSANPFAAIGVTYPAGSTCTCSNGTITLTAGNTDGRWVFAVPAVGTWTLSCTDGTDSDSKSVSITAEGWFESVELSYNLTIFANGAYKSDITMNNMEIENNRLVLTAYQSTNALASTEGYSNVKIDLTDYNTLILRGEYYNANNGDQGYRTAYVGASTSLAAAQKEDVSGNYAAYKKIVYNDLSDRKYTDDIVIDVSELRGEYYVSLHITASNGYTYWYVDELILE